jgi:hypothetical protein
MSKKKLRLAELFSPKSQKPFQPDGQKGFLSEYQANLPLFMQNQPAKKGFGATSIRVRTSRMGPCFLLLLLIVLVSAQYAMALEIRRPSSACSFYAVCGQLPT